MCKSDLSVSQIFDPAWKMLSSDPMNADFVRIGEWNFNLILTVLFLFALNCLSTAILSSDLQLHVCQTPG